MRERARQLLGRSRCWSDVRGRSHCSKRARPPGEVGSHCGWSPCLTGTTSGSPDLPEVAGRVGLVCPAAWLDQFVWGRRRRACCRSRSRVSSGSRPPRSTTTCRRGSASERRYLASLETVVVFQGDTAPADEARAASVPPIVHRFAARRQTTFRICRIDMATRPEPLATTLGASPFPDSGRACDADTANQFRRPVSQGEGASCKEERSPGGTPAPPLPRAQHPTHGPHAATAARLGLRQASSLKSSRCSAML